MVKDNAYHLTSTATLLIRCALETAEQDAAKSCLSTVDSLRALLRRVRVDEDWDLADMCLDHLERILSKHGGNGLDENQNVSYEALEATTLPLPETQTHNDIVDDMMSISGAFGTMDGFPFDLTGIWDISGLQENSF